MLSIIYNYIKKDCESINLCEQILKKFTNKEDYSDLLKLFGDSIYDKISCLKDIPLPLKGGDPPTLQPDKRFITNLINKHRELINEFDDTYRQLTEYYEKEVNDEYGNILSPYQTKNTITKYYKLRYEIERTLYKTLYIFQQLGENEKEEINKYSFLSEIIKWYYIRFNEQKHILYDCGICSALTTAQIRRVLKEMLINNNELKEYVKKRVNELGLTFDITLSFDIEFALYYGIIATY